MNDGRAVRKRSLGGNQRRLVPDGKRRASRRRTYPDVQLERELPTRQVRGALANFRKSRTQPGVGALLRTEEHDAVIADPPARDVAARAREAHARSLKQMAPDE